MQINQLSIFVENKSGRLMEIMDVLEKAGINVSALSLADTTDFGILRTIVDDPEKAKLALRESGVIVKTAPVIALPIDDTPGGLAKMLAVLSNEKVAVEYMYAFCTRTHGKAMMVLKVDDSAKAQAVLTQKGYGDVDPKEFFKH